MRIRHACGNTPTNVVCPRSKGTGCTLAAGEAKAQSRAMLLALVCLWIGFAAGLVCASLMRASGDRIDEDRDAASGLHRVVESHRRYPGPLVSNEDPGFAPHRGEQRSTGRASARRTATDVPREEPVA